jgi:hypothetical protein
MGRARRGSMKYTVLFLFCIGLASAQVNMTPRCDDLQNATPEAMVAYLERAVPNVSNKECVTIAIHRLNGKHFEPAVPILIRLLDFHRPLTKLEKDGFVIGLQGLDDMYPAVEALIETGRQCLPHILEAIKSNSTSVTARKNAVEVWMYFFRDDAPNGIAQLKREADKSNDPAVRWRILSSVNDALTLCQVPSATAEKCRVAASAGRSD